MAEPTDQGKTLIHDLMAKAMKLGNGERHNPALQSEVVGLIAQLLCRLLLKGIVTDHECAKRHAAVPAPATKLEAVWRAVRKMPLPVGIVLAALVHSQAAALQPLVEWAVKIVTK